MSASEVDQETVARRARIGLLGLIARAPQHVERQEAVLQEALAALQVLDPTFGGQAPHGALVVSVNVRGGRVVLQFGEPVAWLGMTPSQARKVAAALESNAELAAKATGGPSGEEVQEGSTPTSEEGSDRPDGEPAPDAEEEAHGEGEAGPDEQRAP